jgi:ribosomal protein S2
MQYQKKNFTKNSSKQSFLGSQENLFSKTKLDKAFLPSSIHRKFFEELARIEAFQGSHQSQTHFSQRAFLLGYRNIHSFSDLQHGFLGFQGALQFLEKFLNKPSGRKAFSPKQNFQQIVFVGNPPGGGEMYSSFFSHLGITFFEQGEWLPGYLSKNPACFRKVIVIYDPSSNQEARSEALARNVPIVAFLPSCSDIRGVDYPIPLNLDLNPGWLLNLWHAFFCKLTQEDTKVPTTARLALSRKNHKNDHTHKR